MADSLNPEYDIFIDPILADESVWNVPSNFHQAKRELYVSLLRKGYSRDYVCNVASELIKRWSALRGAQRPLVIEEDDEEVDLDEWLQERIQQQ